MLPTKTLNPTTVASTAGASVTGSAKSKRNIVGSEGFMENLNHNIIRKRSDPHNADRWWWIGVGMTSVGGIAYFYF